ncbi:hypothetical protein niasHT_038555 [Heterodera trifolii]|uniref:G-protein coupled receptors family 1 profile domain-containing protein n=1 Tax=Heterodera trifolii TaxID=157864 RepID=A0ABD2HZQ8_9BILA
MADLNITFLLELKNESPNWKLISCAAMFGIIATMGIVINFSVIYVTIRTKKLNGTVNYLLALCSFFEILHQFGHFLFVYTAFSGQNLIEYRLAAKILLIPMLGVTSNLTSMLFTGVDRLIILVFGEMHNKFKIRLYLAMITIISVFCGCFVCFNVFNDGALYGDVMITGCIIDFFKFATTFHFVIFLLIIIMTIIVYLLVGMVIKFKSAGLPSTDQINHRVFRALCFIITLNIGDYFIGMLVVSLIKLLIPSPITACKMEPHSLQLHQDVSAIFDKGHRAKAQFRIALMNN